MVTCRNKCKRKKKCCSALSRKMSLQELVEEFIETHRKRIELERQSYRSLNNINKAVFYAAHAICPDTGKMHPHQSAMGRHTPGMCKVAMRLHRQHRELDRTKTFKSIYEIVEKATFGIFKKANLYIYDTSYRIAAFKRIFPDKVYLHRGTLEGAKMFNKEFKDGDIVYTSAIFGDKIARLLKSHEAEDFLCICKNKLSKLK